MCILKNQVPQSLITVRWTHLLPKVANHKNVTETVPFPKRLKTFVWEDHWNLASCLLAETVCAILNSILGVQRA